MASGGKRDGAGRKAAPPGEKRVQMVVTIDPATKARLQAISKSMGMSPGRLVDTMVQRYEKE